MNSSSFRPPFTPSQWQELEQQALIFKYLMAGLPIPPDLLIPIQFQTAPFFPTMGGYCSFYGKKPDPEPGRCRRTDGKKWRCAKDAHPDSKYCDRHMHRGRNRSRKPVETQSSSSASANPSSQLQTIPLSYQPATTEYSYGIDFHTCCCCCSTAKVNHVRSTPCLLKEKILISFQRISPCSSRLLIHGCSALHHQKCTDLESKIREDLSFRMLMLVGDLTAFQKKAAGRLLKGAGLDSCDAKHKVNKMCNLLPRRIIL